MYVCVCVCDLLSLIAAETVMNTCRRGSVAVSVAVDFVVCVAVCVAVTFLSTTRRLLIQKNESITTIETHTCAHAHTHAHTHPHTRTHTVKLSLGSDKAHCGAALSAAPNAK